MPNTSQMWLDGRTGPLRCLLDIIGFRIIVHIISDFVNARQRMQDTQFSRLFFNISFFSIYTFFTRSYSSRSVKRSRCTRVMYRISVWLMMSSVNSVYSLYLMPCFVAEVFLFVRHAEFVWCDKLNVGLKWDIPTISECTVRPYFRSPTIVMLRSVSLPCVFWME